METLHRSLVVGVGDPVRDQLVLEAAVGLARRAGATLHVVHTYALPLLASSPGLELEPQDIADHRARTAEAFTSRVRARYPDDAIDFVIELGPAHEVIAASARELDADLVIVGAHQRKGFPSGLLGTVTQRVLRASPAPVLIARTEVVRPRRILLTTDLSELSAAVHERGLDLVDGLRAPTDARLRSLMVVGLGLPPITEDVLQSTAREALDGFLAARRKRWTGPESAVRGGNVADEIVLEAREWRADLVILGTHARHGVHRLLLGSVAEAAVRELPCNVLVVPPGPVASHVLEPALAGAAAG